MRTPEEIIGKWLTSTDFTTIKMIKSTQTEAYNQAVRDCAKSATAHIAQETVNGGKVAKVNQESILKNLKP